MRFTGGIEEHPAIAVKPPLQGWRGWRLQTYTPVIWTDGPSTRGAPMQGRHVPRQSGALRSRIATHCHRRWPTGLLGAMALVSGSAGAETWYWRPDRSWAYGTGDGSTYANAWRRASEIRWSAMRPGDVLYVCGMHKDGGDDRQIVVGARGITISGACSGDPGRLWSTGRKLTQWARTGRTGVYASSYSGSAKRALNATQKPLLRLSAIPKASSPCDSWFQSDRFYYKPCGAPVAVHPSGPSPAVLVRFNDVTIEDLTIFNSPRLVEVHNSSGVTLRRLHLYYGDRQGVQLKGTTASGRILDSEIHDVGNGIIATSRDAGRHDGWVVERNYVHDVKGSPRGDAHCIGWQNGNGNRIRNNRLEDCAGPALAIYWWGEQGTLKNNEWSYNQIASPANTGISISGNNCPPVPGDASGNVALANEVLGAPLGFYVKVTPHSLSVLDNIVTDAEIGLKWKYISGGNTASSPPPFIETGNTWDAAAPYLAPAATHSCGLS
jgi:hypothetical protein